MVAKFSARHDFLWFTWRTFRWLVLHPLALAGMAIAGWLWSLGLPFPIALLLGILPQIVKGGWEFVGLVAGASRRQTYSLLLPMSTNHTNSPTLYAMWWRIHRGWGTGIRKAGFLQPGRGGQTPRLRHWELTGAGLSAWVTCGRFGWTADGLAGKAETIAAGIKRCRGVTVTQGNYPGVARIDFAFTDPLADIVPLTRLAAPPKGRLTCGVTERGEPAHLHAHLSTLIVGLPGSGKSNLLWTLITSALASGQPFELWVLDPAGGVELWELSNGSPLVRAYAASPTDMRQLVKELHAAMLARMEAMAGKERLHTPTKEQPRWFLVIDEQMRAHHNLGKVNGTDYSRLLVEIMSLGRKAAITVISLTQIPFAHSIGEQVRILFPQKIVFRANDFMVTNSVFGGGSEALGAAASKISIKTPGVGFMILDSDLKPARFRSPLITDAMASLIARGMLPDGIPTADDAGARDWHNAPHVLYRWDNQARSPVCRYVGITVDGVRRAGEHLSTVAKAELREPGVTMTIVQEFTAESCAEQVAAGRTVKQVAEETEAAMIRELEPPLNIAHNGARRGRKALGA